MEKELETKEKQENGEEKKKKPAIRSSGGAPG